MELSVRSMGIGVNVVDVRGEVDADSGPSLLSFLYSLIGSGCRTLLLNLRSVSYVDMAGLGAIAGGVREIRPLGGRLAVVAPQPQVRVLLESTPIHRVAPVYNSEDEALGEIGARC